MHRSVSIFLIKSNTWRYFNVETTYVFNGKISVRNELIVISPGTISYNIGKGITTYKLGNWGSKSNYSSTKYQVTNVNFRQSVRAEDLPIPIPYDPKK